MVHRGKPRQSARYAAPAQVTHTNSKKWVAPRVQEQNLVQKLETLRNHYCPNSFAWTSDLPIKEHWKECDDLTEKYHQDCKAREQTEKDKMVKARKKWGIEGQPACEVKAVKVAFNGRSYCTNHSTVLARQTVFTPSYEYYRACELARWPTPEEQRYEGDDRIATDPLHGRFLALPRMSGNRTVTWMQRSKIDQYPFDDFYYGYAAEWDEGGELFRSNPDYLRLPNSATISFRVNYIPALQCSDEQGRKVLGSELWSLIDI